MICSSSLYFLLSYLSDSLRKACYDIWFCLPSLKVKYGCLKVNHQLVFSQAHNRWQMARDKHQGNLPPYHYQQRKYQQQDHRHLQLVLVTPWAASIQIICDWIRLVIEDVLIFKTDHSSLPPTYLLFTSSIYWHSLSTLQSFFAPFLYANFSIYYLCLHSSISYRSFTGSWARSSPI